MPWADLYLKTWHFVSARGSLAWMPSLAPGLLGPLSLLEGRMHWTSDLDLPCRLVWAPMPQDSLVSLAAWALGFLGA